MNNFPNYFGGKSLRGEQDLGDDYGEDEWWILGWRINEKRTKAHRWL